MIHNLKNGQYKDCVTILYISKLIAKIGGALYIKVSITTLISSLVVLTIILIMAIYLKLNSQIDNIYLEQSH